MTTAPRAVPEGEAAQPYATPADLEVLYPGVPPAQADSLLMLASRAVRAYTGPLYDPVSDAVVLATATLAARQASYLASLEGGDEAGGVVSAETLGAYTVRYAGAGRPGSALSITPDLEALLGAERPGVYMLDTGSRRAAWPVDWWQRNLDTAHEWEAPPAGGSS